MFQISGLVTSARRCRESRKKKDHSRRLRKPQLRGQTLRCWGSCRKVCPTYYGRLCTLLQANTVHEQRKSETISHEQKRVVEAKDAQIRDNARDNNAVESLQPYHSGRRQHRERSGR